MSEGGYPPVFMVDTHSTTRPPVPPRLSRGRPRPGAVQTLLIMLVSVALCGMAIEACFIYRLYQPDSETSAWSSKFSADISSTKKPSLVLLPSKPVAHLTDGQDVVHENQVMAWSMDAEPLLYEMDYKDRCLVIQKEGYYYVYSKVTFFDHDTFHHSVNRETKLYPKKPIPLLMSRTYTRSRRSDFKRSNSYLGGVFHLVKDDTIFVKVKNTSRISRQQSFENIFGAYMI